MVLTKLNNRELVESVFKQIEQEGFHPIDIVYGDSYFLFEDQENSICHFHIKEVPGFLFAFWNTCRFDNIKDQLNNKGIGHTWADYMEISPLSELVFFTQFERELDKFKPSRSGFVYGIYRRTWEEGTPPKKKEEWDLDSIISILEFMQKHPYKAYMYAGLQSRYIWEEISGWTCFKTYIKEKIYYKKAKRKEAKKLKRIIEACYTVLNQIKTFEYSLEDYGENYSPRIHLHLREQPKLHQYLDLEKQNAIEYDLLEKFEDKYWRSISINYWQDPDLEKDIFG